jgi:hypothetical protein
MVSTDDITQINNKNLMGQHPGFASVFGSQIGGSVGPDTLCGDPRHGPPEQPLHEWRSARLVNPTRSQNKTLTTLRSSPPRRHNSKRRTARQAEFRSPRIVLTAVSAHRHDRIVMEDATHAQPWLHSEGRERGHILRDFRRDEPGSESEQFHQRLGFQQPPMVFN